MSAWTDSHEPSGTTRLPCHSPTRRRHFVSLRWNVPGAAAYAYSLSFGSRYRTTQYVRGEPDSSV